MLICGASFAGLAVARELARTGAKVLIVDRYELGERQTSACGIPTVWLQRLGLESALRQTLPEMRVHTPRRTVGFRLPWSFSTFDYRELCGLLAAQGSFDFELAAVQGRAREHDPAGGERDVVITDRGELRAPLIVDALGWRRVLGGGAPIQPPHAELSRGLEVHPAGSGSELELWIDPRYAPAGYAWSIPAGNEVHVGVGSFDPAFHVRQSTVRLTRDLGHEPDGYQGNWIPHRLGKPTEDGVFFVGDSAGHCAPLTAEGIRPALYFGIALGRQLAEVLSGRQSKAMALAAYGAFHESHRWKYDMLLSLQRLIPRLSPRALLLLLDSMRLRTLRDAAFNRYLRLAPPEFV